MPNAHLPLPPPAPRPSHHRRRARIARPARPGHYWLWLCIHKGEGAWNANTGNGYYGGLQMHRGWGGVTYPHLLSPLQQIRLAERVYRSTGYSRSWLSGQWPNTVRPCWRFA